MPAPKALRTEVSAEDLRGLDAIHRILTVLNEPAARADALAPLIAQIPVLAARLDSRYPARNDNAASSARGLSIIGNRAIEAALVELLEDLTVLQAELQAT